MQLHLKHETDAIEVLENTFVENISWFDYNSTGSMALLWL